MNDLVCNYATVRFLPYRESGEFVNVGVVVHCPQTGFLDFRLIKGRSHRVRTFFPELTPDILKSAVSALTAHLQRQRNEADLFAQSAAGTVDRGVANFQRLLRRSESLLHFAEAGSLLTADPKVELGRLFDRYINRSFAKTKQYQESVMREKLVGFLEEWNLKRHYKRDKRLGDPNFHVVLPFVYSEHGRAVKAIKPLDLARPEPTDVYDHGDAWVQRFRRLKKMDQMPEQLIVPVNLPDNQASAIAPDALPAVGRAAVEICEALKAADAEVVPFQQTDRIRELVSV